MALPCAEKTGRRRHSACSVQGSRAGQLGEAQAARAAGGRRFPGGGRASWWRLGLIWWRRWLQGTGWHRGRRRQAAGPGLVQGRSGRCSGARARGGAEVHQGVAAARDGGNGAAKPGRGTRGRAAAARSRSGRQQAEAARSGGGEADPGRAVATQPARRWIQRAGLREAGCGGRGRRSRAGAVEDSRARAGADLRTGGAGAEGRRLGGLGEERHQGKALEVKGLGPISVEKGLRRREEPGCGGGR